jgi:LCP family protein required for cell wall assembly
MARGKKPAPKARKDKKKPLHPFWKFMISFLVTIVVVCGALYGVYLYVFSGLQTEAPISDEQAGIEGQSYHSDKITNIALFGIDSTNKNKTGRSDSIVIVSIDEERNEIRMSAIERDTYVRIQYTKKDGTEVDKMDKLNHAYAFGGAELAIQTLNKNFGLDIRHYATVNFNDIMTIVDSLGGIRMNVPANKIPEANRLIRDVHTKGGRTPDLIDGSGYQTLSGVQVLALSRVRVVGGTSGRASMHEQVLAACFDRIKEKNPAEYPEIAKELLSIVQTTLTAEDITGMATKVIAYNMEQAVFPLEMDWEGPNMINGVWYRTYKEEPGKAHLIDFIYRDILPEEAKK